MTDECQALIAELESRGFEVEIIDTERIGFDQFICRLRADKQSRGYFGKDELSAIRKAVEAECEP